MSDTSTPLSKGRKKTSPEQSVSDTPPEAPASPTQPSETEEAVITGPEGDAISETDSVLRLYRIQMNVPHERGDFHTLAYSQEDAIKSFFDKFRPRVMGHVPLTPYLQENIQAYELSNIVNEVFSGTLVQ